MVGMEIPIPGHRRSVVTMTTGYEYPVCDCNSCVHHFDTKTSVCSRLNRPTFISAFPSRYSFLVSYTNQSLQRAYTHIVDWYSNDKTRLSWPESGCNTGLSLLLLPSWCQYYCWRGYLPINHYSKYAHIRFCNHLVDGAIVDRFTSGQFHWT